MLITWSKDNDFKMGVSRGEYISSFGANRSSVTGDIMYLICHMNSQDLVNTGSCYFMGGRLAARHFSDKTGDHKHYDSADLMFLVCHVTSSDHMFKSLCDWVEAH